MRIAVLGAAGKVGRRVVNEALFRGYDVTAVIRNPTPGRVLPEAAVVRIGDVTNINDVITISKDHDVVVNAARSATSNEHEVVEMTRVIMDGLAHTGVRLLVVGGAASLIVPGTGGRTVIEDTRFLSSAARPVGLASLTQYEICLAETRVDWTYLSPPAELVPGDRTGSYRLGRDELILDSNGKSRISFEDLAVVLLDEAERPMHRQTRFTAAY